MENDPNKKESKGKRILKKALRRSSKSSNESSLAVSRSKSSESKPAGPEGSDSAPLPKSDGAAPVVEETPDIALKKTVDIQEEHNTIHEDATPASQKVFKPNSPDEYFAEPSTSNRKRKVEEEGLAGTSSASAGNSDNDADDKDSKDKKKKNRCAVCRKKVGLTGFECRCGGLFCAVHRYSDKHECSFDYRELGAQEIRRNNPVVVSQKIHKI